MRFPRRQKRISGASRSNTYKNLPRVPVLLVISSIAAPRLSVGHGVFVEACTSGMSGTEGNSEVSG